MRLKEKHVELEDGTKTFLIALLCQMAQVCSPVPDHFALSCSHTHTVLLHFALPCCSHCRLITIRALFLF